MIKHFEDIQYVIDGFVTCYSEAYLNHSYMWTLKKY